MNPSHDWTDHDGDGDSRVEDDSRVEVRHVQPYRAEKSYRCPGCDHEIRPGEGHKVVIPRAAPDDRRHWHTGCWHGEERRTGKSRTR
jgi:hypothetical protein